MILDGHGSHITLKAIEQMQEFGLNMVTLPFSYFTCIPTPRCLLFQTIQDCI
jgi:hypothetical protein